MPIRPIDVRRKEFRNGFRGYDANQVDDFLDAVADEFERTYTETSRLREEVSSLRERLQQFEELEGSIRSALVHAEQAANDLRRTATWEAEDVRKSAAREADLTVREAQARAHQMLAESSARVERIQESYEALQEAKRTFTNDFRQLLKTYANVMDSMEISSAREIEASLRERLDTESMAVAREAASQETVEYPAPDPEAADRRGDSQHRTRGRRTHAGGDRLGDRRAGGHGARDGAFGPGGASRPGRHPGPRPRARDPRRARAGRGARADRRACLHGRASRRG
jgi:cell division initiation protein